MLLPAWLLLLCCLLAPGQVNAASRPHILFIVADDYGWNDIGFRNPDMITPHLDSLAGGGVILNQSYVLPVCSPSRSAFMTGVYPFKLGTQHDVIRITQAVCVPPNYTLLPQELQKLGYVTHAIGKWHLGFCNWNCTPTYRGFDSFFGYYSGAEDYYTHHVDDYLDFHADKLPLRNYTGEYSTFAFAQRAVDIINSHDPSTPLFMYLPFQAVHAPMQVPEKYEKMYPNVVNRGRRKYCANGNAPYSCFTNSRKWRATMWSAHIEEMRKHDTLFDVQNRAYVGREDSRERHEAIARVLGRSWTGMVTALDEGVGRIVQALKQRGLYQDTLILFTGDNGPEVQTFGTCYPLRGGKHTLFEGGTRANAFLHGWGLQKPGSVYNYMVHAVDWLPTLVAAAGGRPPEGLDGINQWEELKAGTPSKRTEMVYNLDNFDFPTTGHAAIRVGRYKLMEGYPGNYDGWYKPMNDTLDTVLVRNIFIPGDTFPVYLFDLENDPTEHEDLSRSRPDLVASLRERIQFYRRQMVPAMFPAPDPKADPRKFGDVWSPGWC